MAWEVAVVLTPNFAPSKAAVLASYMPIWIADTPSNQPCATEAHRIAGDLWKPEPSCTTFASFTELSAADNFANISDAVVLHHPHLAKMNIFGVEDTCTLQSHMSQLGFQSAKPTWDDALAFRKPISMLDNVQHLTLSAKRWHNSDDVYDDLFHFTHWLRPLGTGRTLMRSTTASSQVKLILWKCRTHLLFVKSIQQSLTHAALSKNLLD
jgi:hypothetical protein